MMQTALRRRSAFASDNASGVLPAAWHAMARANDGYALAYGHDRETEALRASVQRAFGAGTAVFPVATGTAANVLAVAGTCRPWDAVLAAAGTHIAAAECGAVEAAVGCKVMELPHTNGKISPSAVDIATVDDEHVSRSRLLTLTQPTDWGSTYTPEELSELVKVAHARGLLVHIDGARLSNAAAHLGCSLAQASLDAGADLLSLGGTKAGLLNAEAVVVAAYLPHDPFRYARMQLGHLVSKQRFASAQLVALLEDDAVAEAGRHANRQARGLARGLVGLGIQPTRPVEANLVHIKPADSLAQRLVADWDVAVKATGEIRLVTSWETQPHDLDALLGWLATWGALAGLPDAEGERAG